MKKIIPLLVVLAALLFQTSLHSQGYFSQLHSIETSAGRNSSVESLATDALGCTYILGDFDDSIYFCSDTLGAINGRVFLAKFDPVGNCLWVKHFDARWASSDLLVTPSGEIVLAVQFPNHFYYGGDSLTGANDIAIVKLDGSGNLLWMKSVVSVTSSACVAGLGLDNSGNVFLGVRAYGTCNVDTAQVPLVSAVTSFIVKYSSAGQFNWVKPVSSTNTGTGGLYDIACHNNHIFIVGSIVGTSLIGTTSYSITSSVGRVFLAGLDSSGSVLWVQTETASGPNEHFGKSISTDLSGNIFITGNCKNTFAMDTISTLGALDPNLYVACFNNNGNVQWINRASGNQHDFRGQKIINDANGNTYVAGVYQRPTAYYSMYLAKYGPQGNVLWTDTTTNVGNFADNWVYGIGLDPFDNVIFGGVIGDGTIYFGHDSISSFPADHKAVFGVRNNSNALIKGKLFNDLNANGIQDVSENGIAHQLMVLAPGPSYTFTNATGDYTFALDTGIHTNNNLGPLYYQDIAPVSPDYYTDTINSFQDTLWNNFAVQAIPGFYDVVTTLTALNRPSAGRPLHYYITITNIGTEDILNDTLRLHHDDTLAFLSCLPVYDQYVNHELAWRIDTLHIGETKCFRATLTVPPDGTLMGTYVSSYAEFSVLNDQTLIDNSDTLTQLVVAAFDPNYKEVSPAGSGPEGYILPSVTNLTYTIHFQNTGTDTAQTVILIDTIDASFDLTSIQMLSSSFPFTCDVVAPRIVKWTFTNIMLPDSTTDYEGSMGFVKFRIDLNPNLPQHQVIHNSAAIFFDYNPAVLTNRTTTTIDFSLAAQEWSQQDSPFEVYPNPFSDQFEIKNYGKNPADEVLLYDLSGKVIARQNFIGPLVRINTSGISPGMYFYQIIDKQGIIIGNGKVIHQ